MSSNTKREEGRKGGRREGREEKGRMERRGREEEKEEGERKKEELNVPDMSHTTVSTSLSIASLTSFPSAHFNFSRIAPV